MWTLFKFWAKTPFPIPKGLRPWTWATQRRKCSHQVPVDCLIMNFYLFYIEIFKKLSCCFQLPSCLFIKFVIVPSLLSSHSLSLLSSWASLTPGNRFPSVPVSCCFQLTACFLSLLHNCPPLNSLLEWNIISWIHVFPYVRLLPTFLKYILK